MGGFTLNEISILSLINQNQLKYERTKHHKCKTKVQHRLYLCNRTFFRSAKCNSQKYLAKNHYFPLLPKPGVWQVQLMTHRFQTQKKKEFNSLNMKAKKLICAGRILP